MVKFFLQFTRMCGRINELLEIRKGGMPVIEVTKINGIKVLINPDLLELVEETPDTVITLTDGKKIIVKESRYEVKSLVRSARQEYFKGILSVETS